MADKGLPPKKKTKKVAKSVEGEEKPRRKQPEDHGRILSYVMGVFFILLGGGMLLGFTYLQRAPGKLFNLLVGGGVGVLLAGFGLLISPMNEEQLNVFQNEPNPVSVFKVMTVFWKVWLIVILAGMIGGFIYVAQNTVRVG